MANGEESDESCEMLREAIEDVCGAVISLSEDSLESLPQSADVGS